MPNCFKCSNIRFHPDAEHLQCFLTRIFCVKFKCPGGAPSICVWAFDARNSGHHWLASQALGLARREWHSYLAHLQPLLLRLRLQLLRQIWLPSHRRFKLKQNLLRKPLPRPPKVHLPPLSAHSSRRIIAGTHATPSSFAALSPAC